MAKNYAILFKHGGFIMIRKIKTEDKLFYLDMAKSFYSSKAVDHNIPEKYIINTFNELMQSDNYAEGYIMEQEGNIAGYALLAKTFSQEAGGITLWIDELYVMPEYRSCGLGHEFFSYLKNNLCDNVKRIRLEVEDSNKKAILLYKEMGFENLPYSQMIKDL
jgi:ribosomal protein S18 acetylase RimI-like enzyme